MSNGSEDGAVDIDLMKAGTLTPIMRVASTGVSVGVDDAGYDVQLFGATAGSHVLWDQSDDALLLTDSTPIKIGDGADMHIYHDGSHSYITNETGTLKLATETSGIAVTIGHGTSETTVADNLTVTGDLSVSGAAPALKSTIVAFSRTASAGSGDQAITGAGFAPSAAVIFATEAGGTVASFGFGDDAAGEGHIRKSGSAWAGVSQAVNLNDAGDVMDAVVKTMDADGLTLTWTKTSSGVDVDGVILFIR